MALSEIALVVAALAAGSFVFGAAGFAFGLVTVPLLGIILPLREAIALQLPYAFLLTAAFAWHYRRHLAWRTLGPLLATALVTLPVGVAALEYAPERALKLALAVFIVSAVALQRLRASRQPPNGYVYGAVSGFFQGAFTTGGPPAMAYFLAACREPHAVKATHGLYFVFLYAATTAFYAAGSVVSWDDLARAVAFAPAVLAGGLAGHRLGARLGLREYHTLVNGLLLASALMLAVRA